MKNKKLLFLHLFFFSVLGCMAQQSDTLCGQERYLRQFYEFDSIMYRMNEHRFMKKLIQFRENNPDLDLPDPYFQDTGIIPTSALCLRAEYTIPVIVHIVHDPTHTDPGVSSNISNSQVSHQIELLNKHFSNYNNIGQLGVNTGIQFCLAPKGIDGNGIIRYPSSVTYNTIGEIDSLKVLVNSDSIPFDKYLHIFVVSEIAPVADNIKGYASTPIMPSVLDIGIVVRYEYFGNVQTCSVCIVLKKVDTFLVLNPVTSLHIFH
jgi:hypothetical protein